MLLLIDNYDSFTYNLVHFLGELGAEARVHRNDKITVNEALSTRPQAIVLSPGPCNPDKAGICLDLIAKAGDTVPMSASAIRPLARPSAARSSARRSSCTAR